MEPEPTASASDVDTSPPVLIIHIKEISPRGEQRHTEEGHWKPSKKASRHVHRRFVENPKHNDRFYIFEGGRIHSYDKDKAREEIGEEKLVCVRIATVYFEFNASRFWCIDKNATSEDIGDGEDSPVEDGLSDSDAAGRDITMKDFENSFDWNPLMFEWFDHIENHTTYGMSKINIEGTGTARDLFMTHMGQTWPRHFLPRNYRPRARERRDIQVNYEPPAGSLCGNVAVLIALVAFSERPEDDFVHRALRQCIRDREWRLPNSGERIGPEPGWDNRRGVVVTVYVRSETNEEMMKQIDRLTLFEQWSIFP